MAELSTTERNVKRRERYAKMQEENPDKYKAELDRKKEWYKKNSEKLNEQFICECGSSGTLIHFKRHLLSALHQKRMDKKMVKKAVEDIEVKVDDITVYELSEFKEESKNFVLN